MVPCQKCHKNPATVHLTEIHGGEKKELHFCEACAQDEEGVNPLNAHSFFAQLMDDAKSAEGEDVDLVCPNCGLSYTEFRQRGRLGCSEDYKLFKEGLTQLLDRIHGSSQHLGKIPARAGAGLRVERELMELKRELGRVVQREEYERAAEIRDRIRRLEEEESSGGD